MFGVAHAGRDTVAIPSNDPTELSISLPLSHNIYCRVLARTLIAGATRLGMDLDFITYAKDAPAPELVPPYAIKERVPLEEILEQVKHIKELAPVADQLFKHCGYI